MVSSTDFATITMLQQQVSELTLGVEILENDGRIVQMRMVSEQDVPPGKQVSVDTAFMTYPQQMIDSIIAQMNQQIADIKNSLTQLGLTG